jgi:dTDP-4-dehydrorhamnose reductase
MNTILLTGVTGQVGQELQQTLTPLGKVIGVTRQQLDLSQPESIREALASVKPNIIVNAAAYTAVDKAETESELAKAINGIAPTVIAQAAQQIGATLVHISTDYVFDGKQYLPYQETDSPNPQGMYGKSKLLGEEGVRKYSDRHIILRTAWVYGSRGHGNFVKTMLRLGKEREEIRVVTDQIGTPTWSYDLAIAISKLLLKLHTPSQSELTNSSLREIYHFTNSGVASWYDFAVAIFAEAQQLDFPLKVKQIIPITTAQYPTPAQRPPYSVLSKVKIAKVLGEYPPYWRDSLKQMLSQLKTSNS